MSKKTIIFLSVVLILLAGGIIIFLTYISEKTKPSLLSDKLNQPKPSDLIIPIEETPQNMPPLANTIKRQGLLYFSPNIINIKNGEEFYVSLMANTFEQELAGIDAVLKYDQGNLKFNKAVNAPDLNLVFPKEPQENLVFSLLAPANKVFTGEIKVADLYFQALGAGQTDITFQSQPGSTSDTNLIAAGQGEILSQAEGVSVIVE